MRSTYYCSKCFKKHLFTSKIGIEHSTITSTPKYNPKLTSLYEKIDNWNKLTSDQRKDVLLMFGYSGEHVKYYSQMKMNELPFTVRDDLTDPFYL